MQKPDRNHDFVVRGTKQLPIDELSLEEVLKKAVASNIINLPRIRASLEMERREEIIQNHPYTVWQGRSNGKWYTYIPDATKERGIALCKRNTKEAIQDVIVNCWTKLEEEKKKGEENTFISVYGEWRKIKDQTVVSNTASKYDSDRVRFFDNTEFSKKKINKISDDDIQIFMCETIKKHKLAKAPTRKLFGYIANTFFFAKKKEFIVKNPAEFFKAKDFYHYCYEKYKPAEGRLVQKDDMKNLQIQFQKDHEKKPNYIPTYAVEFACLTGMRVGEIAALRWDHVETNRIVVEYSEKYNANRTEYWIDRPKNGRIRFFPMTDEIREFLDNLKMVEQKYGYYCEWVFANENGRLHAPLISSCSKTKCRQARVNLDGEKGIRIFRRTLNSNLRSHGVSSASAAEILGHSVQVNEQYYTFDMMNDQDKVQILSDINKSVQAM